jgi:hypothetical protein
MSNKRCKTHCKTFLRTWQKPLCRRRFSHSVFVPMKQGLQLLFTCLLSFQPTAQLSH